MTALLAGKERVMGKRLGCALVVFALGCGDNRQGQDQVTGLELSAVTLTDAQMFDPGEEVTLSATAPEGTSVVIFWGDAQTDDLGNVQGALNATHQYQTLGEFEVAADVCISGTCQRQVLGNVTVSCAAQDTDDCNADIADGCEVNVNTDAGNCGGCGDSCAAATGCVEAETCVAGECTAGATCPIFVDSAGTDGSGCGTGWGTDACETLRGGVTEAVATSNPRVFAKTGTYTSAMDPVVFVNDGVSIYGGFAGTENLLSERPMDPLSSPSVIDGEGARQGVRAGGNNTIDGFKVQNGSAAYGGGLTVPAVDNVTVNHVVFNDNQATSGNAGGGAVYVGFASGVSLSHVDFLRNATTNQGRGGGMFTEQSTTTLNEVLFDDNSAYSADGGGMAGYGGMLTLADVTFQGNDIFSSQDGIGLHLNGVTATLTDVTFQSNWGGYSVDGGGLYATGGSVTGTNVEFNDNRVGSSGDGGGFFASNTDVTLTNVTFDGNEASWYGDGGGLFTRSGGTVSLTSVDFLENDVSYSGAGGGLYVRDATDLTLLDVNFDSNTAGSYAVGGGMYTRSNAFTMSNVVFQQNGAGSSSSYTAAGGGLYVGSSAPATLTNVLFANNWASGSYSVYGGGMFTRSDSTLTNVSFVGNTVNASSSDDGGGGLYSNGGTHSLTNVVFSDNAASSGADDFGGSTSGSSVQNSCVQTTGVANLGLNNAQINGSQTENGGNRLPYLAAGSACIDLGDDTAATDAFAAAGLDDWTTLTTRTDGTVDATPVDAGYHHAEGSIAP